MNSIFWHDFRKAFHPTFRKAFQARIPPFLARFSQRISNTIFVKHPISLFARHSIPLSAKHFKHASHLFWHDFREEFQIPFSQSIPSRFPQGISVAMVFFCI
jgi:hypothetical protein